MTGDIFSGDKYFREGNALFDRNNYDEAITAYTKAIAYFNAYKCIDRKAQCLTQRGLTYLQKNEHEKGIDDFTLAAALGDDASVKILELWDIDYKKLQFNKTPHSVSMFEESSLILKSASQKLAVPEAEVFSGNSEGNLCSNGYFALKDGWLYYNIFSGFWASGELCKVRIDGTGRQTINNGKCLNINVVGGWIYYYSFDDKSHLYKIRTDGTDKQKIIDDSSFFIHATENWIYYINCNEKRNNIYKIRPNGTERQKLNDDECRHLNLFGGWIYYENIKDGYSFYRMRTNGTDRQKIINDQCWGGVNVVDGWIYYVSGNSGSRLYKIRVDGTDKQKLTDHEVNRINVADDWIYYVDDIFHSKIYKVRTDGTDNQKLTDDNAFEVHVADDWIYYMNYSDNQALYKMRTDGTSRQLF